MGERKRLLRFVQRIPIRWRLTLVSWGLLALLLISLGFIISSIAQQALVSNQVAVLRNEVVVAWKGVARGQGASRNQRPFELSSVFYQPGPLPPDFISAATPLIQALAGPSTNAIILTPDGSRILVADAASSFFSRPSTIRFSPDKVQQIASSASPYVIATDEDGVRQLVLFIPLVNNFHGVGILEISTPTTPIDNFLVPFHWVLFLGIVGAICLAIALTFPLVGMALRPLVEIERTSRRIARGELSRRIDPVLANDEIGRLADSFNGMVARLESAFQRQKRFVADVSHELRTPLTALSGSLEMLLIGADRGDVEASRRLVHGMYAEVQRMHRMVEDLLTLTRLDEGKLTLRKEIIAVDLLLQTIYEQAAHLTRGQELSSTVEPGLPAIYGDRDRLQQVLLNLVDNAVKFTPPGGQIEIRAGKGSQNALLLTISDTGQGIAPEVLPHVFDRFYRADPSRSRSPQHAGGSGLGLAIARELIEAQGGTIEISSILGTGTTVTIRFPETAQIVAAATHGRRAQA
jgi:two-component system OmpR family sensor kinase